jgi:hypothetical protein
VAIVSGSQYYNGAAFVPVETWLLATGAQTWDRALPALPDGVFGLRARAVESGIISDTTPASITFTLDRVPPAVPLPITPTGGISLTSAAPTFVWSGGGDPSGFKFELDGVQEVLNSPALSVTRVVTEGVHSWRVNAFDRAGNESGWSTPVTFYARSLVVFMPAITRNSTFSSPPAPTCYEAIANGGFESGFTGWSTPSFTPAPAIVQSPVAQGANAARVGSGSTSSAPSGFSSVQQAVTIPANATSATLAFQRYRISGDTVNDLQYVAVLSGTVVLDYLVYERVHDPAWAAAQFDLLAYAGQPINLRFSVKNDGLGGATGMFVDAVSLQVCTP